MGKNYLLCGVGGQGTVLASRLLASAAMEKGLAVRTAETIGMAQRGGSVVSHVRTGDVVYSPLIPLAGADVVIGFEPAEAARCLPYLKPGGTVIVNTKAIRPVNSSLAGSSYDGHEAIACLQSAVDNLILVDGEEICRLCSSAKVLNVALVAAGVQAGCLDISFEELKSMIERRMDPKFHAPNLRAVDIIQKGTLA